MQAEGDMQAVSKTKVFAKDLHSDFRRTSGSNPANHMSSADPRKERKTFSNSLSPLEDGYDNAEAPNNPGNTRTLQRDRSTSFSGSSEVSRFCFPLGVTVRALIPERTTKTMEAKVRRSIFNLQSVDCMNGRF